MEGKFHLPSLHFSPSFRIKRSVWIPNVSFLPLASMAVGMHDAPPKAKLVHAICPVPLDLMVLTLSVQQSVQGQSRHWTLLVHFSCTISVVVGLLCSSQGAALDYPKGHILLLVQAANKAFEIDSEGPSKTTVETLCLRHCWS